MLTRRAFATLAAGSSASLTGACSWSAPGTPASRRLSALTANDFQASGVTGVGLGVLSAGYRSSADLDAVVAFGADHVRIFIEGRRCEGCDAYEAAPADLAVLDDLLERLSARGVYVVLVLGLGADARGRLWEREALQASAVALWASIARRLKGQTGIAGFDLLNEPVPPGLTYALRQAAWLRFAQRVGEAIRAEDPTRVLIVESAPDATPQSFENMAPIALGNVVYSVHSYHPIDFTHQTVMKEYPERKPYPDPRQTGRGRGSALEEGLAATQAFALKHRVPIYVGEFSALRSAPDGSAARYVSESLKLFAAYGWSWAYHEFRGWDGWDAEKDERGGGRSFEAPVARLLRQAMASPAGVRGR